jgi:CO/xanthine dehydrogenase Mo-binding subunit
MTGLLHEREFSRKQFLKGGGAMVIGFSLAGAGLVGGAAADSVGQPYPNMASIDSWLAIGPDGTVTLYAGKIELGTGSSTGLLQIAAEELDVAFTKMKLVAGITGETPDQYVSSASAAIMSGGPAVRQAAAEARAALLQMASAKLSVPIGSLTIADGVVSGGGKSVSYADLIGGKRFNLTPMTVTASVGGVFGPVLKGSAAVKDPSTYKVVGTAVPRVDIPDKVTGKFTYTRDIRLPGMLHGRVVRPNPWGANLVKVEGLRAPIPDLVKVVVKGDFVGVVAKTEWAAIQAAAELRVKWSDWAEMPAESEIYKTLRSAPVKQQVMLTNAGDVGSGFAGAAKIVSATYNSPYHVHGTIGPSCAVADVSNGRATIWTHSQGVYGLRESLAVLLGMPEASVTLIYVHGGGAFGQNGADDAAADAALLSQAMGTPVRVQWMRQDEHGWAGFAPSRTADLRGGLDAQGNIVAWQSTAWSQAAWNRPASTGAPEGYPGNLLDAGLLGMPPGFDGGFGATTTNSLVPYDLVKNKQSVFNYLGTTSSRSGPIRIRTGSMRTVAGFGAGFPLESFTDELAYAAGADPVQFRLRHLGDQRGIDVLKAAASLANWDTRPSPKPGQSGTVVTGRGVAFSGTSGTRVAVIVDVEVNKKTGKVRVTRACVAQDCGLIVNPEGVHSQVEGNVIMSSSRTIYEQVKFTRSAITSLDWVTYPIMRFQDAPDEIKIQLINHPEAASTGVGEAVGSWLSPAIGNAFFDATGVRMRQLPFTPARVRATLEAAAAGTYR